MTAWRVALPYLVVGCIWIATSDWLLADSFAAGPLPGQTVKGLLFVALTAGLIYILTARELRAKRKSAEERLRLERRLGAIERFEAMGQLTGGIAHDFNNLITAITGHLESCLAQVEPGSRATEELEEARRSAARGAELTRQLLAVGRGQVLRPERLHLNEVIGSITGLLRRLIGERVRINTEFAENLSAAVVDRGGLEQVVMNLAINARDAMPDGGELTIRTGNQTIALEDARRFPFPFAPGEYVRLDVIDTGVGMDSQIQARIFEPFFSTKPKDVGTGLGLATVYGIVKQSGGHVAVTSTPGAGSTFSVYLPSVREVGPVEPVPRPVVHRNGSAQGARTILLVEDDAGVRTFATRTLQRQGYVVLPAAGAGEALDLLRGGDRRIDLLVTDASMPGMSGMQLIDSARASGARVGFLLISGSPDVEASPAVPYLAKPFTAAELGERVRQLLDEPGAA